MKLFIITGTCGAGKSTMKDELAFRLDPNRYQLFINTENRTPHETAETIAAFITGWTEERRSHG